MVQLRAGRLTNDVMILLLSSCIFIGAMMIQQINAQGSSTGSNCGSKTSCRDCLGDDTSTCGWVPIEGCLESCNIIADVACYNIENFNEDNDENNDNAESLIMTGDDICIAADNDMADMDLCSSQTDCTSCVETTLVSETSSWNTCQWFQDGNYCGSECGMVGCGETACSADSSNISVSDNGLDNVVMIDNPSSSVESSSAGESVTTTITTPDGSEISKNNNSNVDDIDNITTETATTGGNDGEGVSSSTVSRNSAMINAISFFWATTFVLICLL